MKREVKRIKTPDIMPGPPAWMLCQSILRTGVVALLVYLFSIMPASADMNDGESTTLSLLKFATGVISAYALHETGHAIAASVTDTDLDWGLGTYNQPLGFTEHATNDGAGMLVHASGLATQAIASEVILDSDSIDKNDNFVRGMMFWNIVNPVIYAMDYWWFHNTNQENGTTYQGDLKGFEHYSNDGTANGFAALMAGLAVYNGYRFLKTQTWAPEWIDSKTMKLNFRTTGGKGAMLAVQIAF